MLKRVKGLLNKKGQTAIEYIVIVTGLLSAIISFYVLYSHLVPKQFEQGAQIILKEYEAN